MPSSLYVKFYVREAREGEIEHILGEHYHGATQAGLNEVDYPSQSGNHALRLVYERHRIVDVLGGPALTDQDVSLLSARIRAELIDDAGHLVGERVLFAKVPVTAAFRYKNIFQISPVPPDAPRPGVILADHPFSLWCRFDNTPNALLRIGRHTVATREIELLLCAITDAGVRALGDSPGHYWGLLPDGNPEIFKVRFQQEFYTYPGMNAHRSDFPDTAKAASIRVITDDDYANRQGISVDQVFDLPASFPQLCDRFFGLSIEQRDAFLTAAFWVQHATRVHRLSRSAYFTALISAIEALLPEAQRGQNCPACDRPTGKGPTKLFIEFCEQFGPRTEQANVGLRKLYGIRSALSHGGKLLPSDRVIWHWGLSAPRIEEWENLTAGSQLVRAVLVGWLNAQGV